MKIVFNEKDDLNIIRNIIKLIEGNHNNSNTEQITLNDPEGEPTAKQIYFLTKNDIPMPDGLTKKQASDMIDTYIKKKKGGNE